MTKPAEPVQKWEHCALVRKTENYLVNEINLLGQEGWELVTVLYYKDLKGVMCWTGFLKRPMGGGRAAAPVEEEAAVVLPAAEQQQGAALEGFNLDDGDFKLQE